MEYQNITGIGCFAKPERLGRILNKLVQNYTLGPFEGNQLHEHLLDENEGVNLLQALTAVMVDGNNPREAVNHEFKESKKIIGFYLNLNGQKLNLSIFARGDCTRSEIFTTSLGKLTKLRQKRLN